MKRVIKIEICVPDGGIEDQVESINVIIRALQLETERSGDPGIRIILRNTKSIMEEVKKQIAISPVLMLEPIFCKDCRHHELVNVSMWHPLAHGCKYEKIYDPASGNQVYKRCSELRQEGGPCGPSAKWFEPYGISDRKRELKDLDQEELRGILQTFLENPDIELTDGAKKRSEHFNELLERTVGVVG